MKQPYERVWTLPGSHLDTEKRVVTFVNGHQTVDIDRSNPIVYDRERHYHTSRSTKPWSGKGPQVWTDYRRNNFRVLADHASGRVVWTPPPSSEPWAYKTRTWECSGGWGNVFEGDFGPWWDLQPGEWPDQDDLDNKIRLKLLDSVNAATMMAETSKSVDGIGDRLTKLAKAARHLSRGRVAKAAEALGYPPKKSLSSARRRALSREIPDDKYRALASDWLELQYGWLPMISDIHGLVENVKNSPPRCFIRAYSHNDVRREYEAVQRSRMDGGMSKNRYKLRAALTRGWIAEVRVDDPYIHRMNQNGLLNPAVVAWELVPFSFVIDWFLPIGDFLNSASATFGTTVIGNLFIEKERTERILESSLISASSQDSASGAGVYARQWNIASRSSPGFPSAKFPSFKNPLSTAHAANALALLTSLFKR